ncbi:MAG: energy transducer TonB [Chitinophagaceae bacterium]|nr:MAG: energy transducer TonB [Chitinophagaceae bacterium]
MHTGANRSPLLWRVNNNIDHINIKPLWKKGLFLFSATINDFMEFFACHALNKKQVMDAKHILHADWLDLLFEGRNKLYGAYKLRKKYKENLIAALLISFAFALLGYFALPSSHTTPRVSTVIAEIEPALVALPPKSAVLPIQQPVAKRSSSSFKRDRYVEPVVQNNVEPVETVNNLDPGASISGTSSPGSASHPVSTPVESPTENGPSVSTFPVSIPESILHKVEIEAAFPGGLKAWKRYLERTLDAGSSIIAGAPDGIYTVTVRFVVDKDGSISDVVALTQHGYGMEDEAIKVIRRGPKWIPAIQNGTNVKAYRSQSITFVLTSN